MISRCLLVAIFVLCISTTSHSTPTKETKYLRPKEPIYMQLISDANYHGFAKYLSNNTVKIDEKVKEYQNKTPLYYATELMARLDGPIYGYVYRRNLYLIIRHIISFKLDPNIDLMGASGDKDLDPMMVLFAQQNRPLDQWIFKLIEDFVIEFPGYQYNRITKNGDNIVNLSARRKKIILLQKLIHTLSPMSTIKLDLDGRKDPNSQTALMYAFDYGDFEMVSYLLKLGANKYAGLGDKYPTYAIKHIYKDQAEYVNLYKYVIDFRQDQLDYYTPKSYDFVRYPDEPDDDSVNIHISVPSIDRYPDQEK